MTIGLMRKLFKQYICGLYAVVVSAGYIGMLKDTRVSRHILWNHGHRAILSQSR